MSGPLCDAVLARSGSGQMLASLERSNLLLATLDRHRGWYRYHHLFHEPLQAELERREPELVEGLHARAAAWCEANGLPELAVDHAQAAGDADRVARLVATLAQPAYAAGRVETVRRWLAWFVDRNLVERYPAVAVLGTYLQALVGLPAAAERWAAAVERARADGKLPDGSTVESWIALARALLCRDGVDQMRPLLTYGLCFLAVQALLELGRAYLALTIGPGSGRPSGRPVTSSSSDPISATCPPRSRTFSRPWSGPAGRGGVSSLTTAGLRLLPLLPTHLSFHEIADRLYLSRNTVKTHAISIYRKLGVSSRGEAVQRAQEIGLL
jgi:ATP/maltotriose-dependent transcriptional regulator MalT